MVSQKASFLQGAFLGSTIVFWGGSLLKCLQIHHYLISYLYFYQRVPEIPKNIVLSGCYGYNEQLSFQEWEKPVAVGIRIQPSTILSGDSRFFLHVREKNVKDQGYDLSTTKYISSNAKGKRTRETTQYTNITTS